jgi:hypothetical protein
MGFLDAIADFSKGDILEGGEQLLCGGVFGSLLPGCSEVPTLQWLAGLGEMAGGGLLVGFGVIELGNAIISGGGTIGLLISTVMVGGGSFALVDGYLRSSTIDYSIGNTKDLAEGIGELTGGAFLAFKGVESAFEVYNGNQFSYFELGMATIGLGGGGYLLWDGYNRTRPLFLSGEALKADKINKAYRDKLSKMTPEEREEYNRQTKEAIIGLNPVKTIGKLYGASLSKSKPQLSEPGKIDNNANNPSTEIQLKTAGEMTLKSLQAVGRRMGISSKIGAMK